MKKKILVITGTRAEYGILSSVMDAIQENPTLALRVLVTGMHTQEKFGKTEKEVAKRYDIAARVPVPERSGMLAALSEEIRGIGEYCEKERPDCIVVLGDRDEPLAAAIVAAHFDIPLAHIHGGDVSGRGVDQENRDAITKMADFHFPATPKSAERLAAIGEPPESIFTVGSPAADFIEGKELFGRDEVAKTLGLDPSRSWLTVLMHPTPFDEVVFSEQISPVLQALAAFPEEEKIIVFPNSDTGSNIFIGAIEALRGERYRLFKSLPREVYLSLVKESDALVGNSSGGIIETGLLGTPAVDIGNRQEGRERGEGVVHTGYDRDAVVSAIERARQMKKANGGKPFSSPYGAPGAGKRIAEVLARVVASNP
jgi:UDP-hydrolysing UDP-N-acetyl-D-glucosamine 2-epimerase